MQRMKMLLLWGRFLINSGSRWLRALIVLECSCVILVSSVYVWWSVTELLTESASQFVNVSEQDTWPALGSEGAFRRPRAEASVLAREEPARELAEDVTVGNDEPSPPVEQDVSVTEDDTVPETRGGCVRLADPWHTVADKSQEAQEVWAYQTLISICGFYGTPRGLCYAVWGKECSRRVNGDCGGYRAAGIVEARCPMMNQKNPALRSENCTKHWLALTSICDQGFIEGPRSGQKICDPQTVNTSSTLAMGPTQHMPGELVDTSVDPPIFKEDAIDADCDGVMNPLELPDAMAMTAWQLREYHDQCMREGKVSENKCWRWAAGRYYGSQTDRYYEGGGKRPGIKRRWDEWCRIIGCKTR